MSEATAARVRAICITNPQAGFRHARREDLPAALEQLRRAGFELEPSELSPDGPSVEDLASRAVAEGAQALIVAGGDGTVQAAAGRLLGTDVTLGILPVGSFMNIANGLGLPLELAAAAAVIARRRVRRVDVGEVNGQVFYEVAGVGLDAEAFGAARAVERHRWRRALRRLRRWATQRSHRVRLVVDGRTQVHRAMQVLVLNGPYYAWSFPVAPEADMSDGLLDFVVFPRQGRRTLLGSLLRLWREGEPIEQPVVQRGREGLISASAPLAIHADGKAAGTLPATFRCRPGALKVFA